MAAAAQEFAEFGFAGATYGSIAARAGVAKTRVQYWAPTKAGLAQEIVSDAFIDGAFAAAHREDMSSGVSAILRSCLLVAQKEQDDVSVRAATRLLAEWRVINAELPTPYVGWVSIIESDLQSAVSAGELPEGLEPSAFAWFLVAGFLGVKTICDTLGGYIDYPQRTVYIVETLLRGVGYTKAE